MRLEIFYYETDGPNKERDAVLIRSYTCDFCNVYEPVASALIFWLSKTVLAVFYWRDLASGKFITYWCSVLYLTLASESVLSALNLCVFMCCLHSGKADIFLPYFLSAVMSEPSHDRLTYDKRREPLLRPRWIRFNCLNVNRTPIQTRAKAFHIVTLVYPYSSSASNERIGTCVRHFIEYSLGQHSAHSIALSCTEISKNAYVENTFK